MNKPASRELLITTLLTGILYYYAIDLSGSLGWQLWIAPLPLLLIAFRSTGRQLFFCAFWGCLIGRMNWVPFLSRVMPIVPVIIISLLIALLYALVMIGTRRIVLARNNFLGIFAYPILMTAAEFASLSLSYDGTAGSLAYTQTNYLSIIQIASVTGIWGILFVTALIPSTLAIAWHLRDDRKQMQFALAAGSLVVCATLAFGWIRVSEERTHTDMTVGLTVVPERLHLFTKTPVMAKEENVALAYRQQILPLAQQGAQVVLFPEKIVDATDVQKDSLMGIFIKMAAESKIILAGGITVHKPTIQQNLVDFFFPDGTVQEYRKVYHVKGFEDGFERGDKVGFLQGLPAPAGTAICKDLDYPGWIRQYTNVQVMFVPAWDFVVDGWQHCRMAIMRGVENGFTVVRAARQGRLTVSDYRGKILGEANCEQGQAASLLAQAPVYSVTTIYSRWGDWFGWLCVFVAVGWLTSTWARKK